MNLTKKETLQSLFYFLPLVPENGTYVVFRKEMNTSILALLTVQPFVNQSLKFIHSENILFTSSVQ